MTNSHKIVNQNLKKYGSHTAPSYSYSLSVCQIWWRLKRRLTSFLTCATFNMQKAYTHILVFYFSAISRDIDLKFIQDTNRIAINSLKKNVFHRSKVTGTVHCFLKVQSYHKNWAIDNFQYLFCKHLFVCPINFNNKNLSEQINDVTIKRQYLTFNM